MKALLFSRFIKDETGASTFEYAVIAALIYIATIAFKAALIYIATIAFKKASSCNRMD